MIFVEVKNFYGLGPVVTDHLGLFVTCDNQPLYNVYCINSIIKLFFCYSTA